MAFYICPFDIKCIRTNSAIPPQFRQNDSLTTSHFRVYDAPDNRAIVVLLNDYPAVYMRDANVIDRSLSFRRTTRRFATILRQYEPLQISVMGVDSGTDWVCRMLVARGLATDCLKDWDIPASPDNVYTDGTGLVGIGSILEIIDWSRIRLSLMKDIIAANSTDVQLEKMTRKQARAILENMLAWVYAI